jgi:uncharacterized protein YbaP (TraB family)
MRSLRHLLPALVAFAALATACGAAPAPIAGAPSAAPDAALGKAFVWRAVHARQPDKVVHILGSVHVGKEGIYPLDRTITEPFVAAQALVVEVNLEALEPAELLVLVLTRAMLPEGETLRDRLSPEAWDRVTAGLQQLGVSVEPLLTYEPWFVAMNLIGVRTVAEGFLPELGIDSHFIGRAEGHMPILELETAEFQIDLFDSMSPEVQELMLLDSIEGDMQTGGDIEELMKLWEAGDAAGLEQLVLDAALEDPTFEPLFQRMVVDRNHTMTARIEELLRLYDSLYVVVGAGHVVGDEGIVSLLRNKGWEVEQLDKRGR